MASQTATARPFRVASRAARRLLEKHQSGRRGGRSPDDGAASKVASPKRDETPWPRPLRYAFYAACVASVPLSIGTAVARSPRLREWMLGDDLEEEGGSSGGFSAREIISLVRRFWGDEEYVPPVDRPQLEHAVPGHRHGWQEDNYSSFLQLFGMYTSGDEQSDALTRESIPMSLDNEPPSNVRREQRILDLYLSSRTNPTGVRTKLSLMPCESDGMDDEAGYETECTLPGNTSTDALRVICQGSDAQSLKRDLAEADPSFRSFSRNETIRTTSWNKDCRWRVEFADSDGDGLSHGEGVGTLSDSFGEGTIPASRDASRDLRHITSAHSSWSHFPEPSGGTASPAGSKSATVGYATPSADASPDTSAEALQIQRLQYEIATLEKELSDPSSMRDRDAMQEELGQARRELRGLRPWWRRFWG